MSDVPTTTRRPGTPAGALVRHWRQLRRLTQLDLSLRADVSQRHLSWVETGRARPSRELLLHLSRVLDVPLRDRNALLHAGGFAPAYAETGWDDEDFAPVRDAIGLLLARHEPNPAVVLDRRWSLVDANDAAVRLITTFGGTRAMAVAEGNAMRLLVHPDGLRRAIVNFDEVGGHLADRIVRKAASYPDDHELATLAEELLSLVGDVPRAQPDASLPLVIASTLRHGDVEVALLSMLASVGGALDVTLSELVVELFYPLDPGSAATLEELATPAS
jgi:transcriptional regulator with XRE-family HTH domain